MKENLKEMYDYLGYEKFNNYVQNSELNEDFKHKVKNFGKVAALNAALLAGSLGLASCTPPTGNNIIPEDTPIENPVEDEEDTEEEEVVEEAPELLSVDPLEGEDVDENYTGNNDGFNEADGTYSTGIKFKFNKEPYKVEKLEIEGYYYNSSKDKTYEADTECDFFIENDYCCVTIQAIYDALASNMSAKGCLSIITRYDNSYLKFKFLFKNGDSLECNLEDLNNTGIKLSVSSIKMN